MGRCNLKHFFLDYLSEYEDHHSTQAIGSDCMRLLDTSLMNPDQQVQCEKFIAEPESAIGPYIICTAPSGFSCGKCIGYA